MNSAIIKKERFPSPHPQIDVFLITYRSSGLLVKGYMASPKKPGKFPGLLYLRGGIKQVGMVRISRITQFASNGFIVFAPCYRGNLGGEGDEDFCGYDRADAINGFHLLRNHGGVITKNVHVFGFSRGAVMALHVAIIERDVTSLVVWGGVSDIALTYEERIDLRRMLKRVIGGTPKKIPEQYKWRTPLDGVKYIKCPLLLIHGKKDTHVSIEHAYRLEQRLKEEQKNVTKWYFDDYSHFFPPSKNRELTQDLCKWMKKQEFKEF